MKKVTAITRPVSFRWRVAKRSALIPTAAMALLAAGCASLGGGSSEGGRVPLVSRFWNRSTPTAQPQGDFDQYAQSAAVARPSAAKELAAIDAANAQASARPKLSVSPIRPESSSGGSLTARAQSPRRRDTKVASAASSKSKTTKPKTATKQDADIRITLGRPESLPTLEGPADSRPAAGEGARDELLAAAPAAGWSSGTASRSRQAVEADALPAPVDELQAPEPPPRRTQNAPARVADATESDVFENDLEPPVDAAPAAKPAEEEKIRSLLAASKDRLDAIETYRVKITRTERVGSQLQPEEKVVLNIRRNPKAVLLEWQEGPSKGREVIYSSAINDRMMYVNMANSALPISRMSIPVDSPLALRNSRHPITEAGFDTILQNLIKHLPATPGAAPLDGKLVYLGVETPQGGETPCDVIERQTNAGETWRVFLDQETAMPVLVTATQTKTGELIERYLYQDFQADPSELVAATAFDPDKRWGESKGWLSRLAKAGTSAPADKPEASTTR